MKHQGGFNFLVIFLLLLCVLVNSSVGYKFCHTRRFVQEQEKINGSVVCADITGSKWKMKKPMENSCKTLEVWVPKKVGFTEFVNVNEHNEVEGGFSIAIFCYVLETLPFSIVPNFIPFVNATGHMNGTYDQLLKQIENQTCAAVAGDVTIRGNRAQYVSFTAPYLSAEVYMIVDATRAWNQTLWTFLRPFTNRVWITLVSACILIGITIAILEYRAENPNFTSPFYRQLIMVMWFPISTIFFNEGKIRNKGSKVILVVWLCMFPIVGQIYTASLSSWLTLNQLRPNLPSSFCDVGIGYPAGSFINDLIVKQYNCSSGNKLRELNGYEEYRKALSDGTVIAVIDELPYVNLFLSMYGSDYMKHGPINQASGIAFAFPLNSSLLSIFSEAVINVTESKNMTDMKQRYFGLPTLDESQPNSAPPQSLDVQSFIGLFIFMRMVMIVAIIASEISRFEIKNIVQHQDKEEENSKELAILKSDTTLITPPIRECPRTDKLQ